MVAQSFDATEREATMYKYTTTCILRIRRDTMCTRCIVPFGFHGFLGTWQMKACMPWPHQLVSGPILSSIRHYTTNCPRTVSEHLLVINATTGGDFRAYIVYIADIGSDTMSTSSLFPPTLLQALHHKASFDIPPRASENDQISTDLIMPVASLGQP